MHTISKPRKDGVDTAVVRDNQNVPLTDGRPLPPALSWMTRCTDLTKTLPPWLTDPRR